MISKEFGEKQRNLLRENLAISLLSGMAIRYHGALQNLGDKLGRLASIAGDPVAPILKSQADQAKQAVAAEVPIAFRLEPSNMSVSVYAVKVDLNTGTQLPHSSVQVGRIGGLAKEGNPSGDFTPEDLSFAVERLKEQKEAGLVYGLQDGSGFLPDY